MPAGKEKRLEVSPDSTPYNSGPSFTCSLPLLLFIEGGQGDGFPSNLFVGLLTILPAYNYAKQNELKQQTGKHREFQ